MLETHLKKCDKGKSTTGCRPVTVFMPLNVKRKELLAEIGSICVLRTRIYI